MAEKNASDLFFSTGAPPHMKVEGVSTPQFHAILFFKKLIFNTL